MNKCPICKQECAVTPADWSGGRMTADCTSCGTIEVGEDNYQELISLPADHWQIQFLRDGISRVGGSVIIKRNDLDTLQAEPLKARLSRIDKRSLRSKAEGKNKVYGQVFYSGKDEQEGT